MALGVDENSLILQLIADFWYRRLPRSNRRKSNVEPQAWKR